MNNEQAVLLSLIRNFVTEENTEIKEKFNTEELFLEAKRQSVFLLAAEVGLKYKDLFEKQETVEYKKLAFKYLTRNNEVENYQKNLVKVLEQKDIKYCIIKGTVSASYYNKPQYRSLGDVDFYIDPNDTKRVADILEAEGYEKTLADHENHIVFKKGRANLELHHSLPGVPKGEKGKKISDFLNNLLYNVESKKVLNTNYSAPSDLHHGLIVLLHTAHHLLNEGLGLRHLLDWGFYAERVKEDSEFNEILLPFLEEIGLLNFAKILTKTTELYLGFSKKEFCKDTDNKLCKELIEDILTAGNFGNKDKAYRYSGILVTDNKNGVGKSKLTTLFKVLDDTIYSKYPVVKKCKLLYPFIFIWRFIRYFFLMLFGKRKTPNELMPIVEKRKELYNKLKIFEEE